MTHTLRLGKYGEFAAARYLRENGYIIETGNYRCPLGEVDIIASKDDTLIFIEVKTRSSKDYALPREFVTKQKQLNIITTALSYMKRVDYKGDIRFDVIEVLVERENPKPVVTHIKGAFDAQDYYPGF